MGSPDSEDERVGWLTDFPLTQYKDVSLGIRLLGGGVPADGDCGCIYECSLPRPPVIPTPIRATRATPITCVPAALILAVAV